MRWVVKFWHVGVLGSVKSDGHVWAFLFRCRAPLEYVLNFVIITNGAEFPLF